MAYDFPASPTENQEFTPVGGGPTYIYKAPRWTIRGGNSSTLTTDTAPTNPTAGQLWWESDTGNLFIWYADVDSSQWVQVSGSVSATPTAETRNRIVNPAMQISQQNGNTPGLTTATSYYSADTWFVTSSAGVSTTTARQEGPTPNNVAYGITNDVNTAKTSLTGADLSYMGTCLEGTHFIDFGWNAPSEASSAVFRFCVFAPIAGTFCVAFNTYPGYAYGLVRTYTITPAEVNTYKYVTLVIPAPPAGTWPDVTNQTIVGMEIAFPLAAGPTFNAAAEGVWEAKNVYGIAGATNGLASADNYLWISEVGLYKDQLNTGIAPRWQTPDEGEELMACQRYLQIHTGLICHTPYGSAGANIHDCTLLPVEMRTSPSASFSGISYSLTNTLTSYLTNTSQFGYYVTINATGTAYVIFNALLSARM